MMTVNDLYTCVVGPDSVYISAFTFVGFSKYKVPSNTEPRKYHSYVTVVPLLLCILSRQGFHYAGLADFNSLPADVRAGDVSSKPKQRMEN